MRFSRHPYVQMKSEDDPRIIMDGIQREWAELQTSYEKARAELINLMDRLNMREAEVLRLRKELDFMHAKNENLSYELAALNDRLAKYEVRGPRREKAETREGA